MGDRANIAIGDGNSLVYLYTHYDGTKLPAILQQALKKNWSWDDGPYLTRIIFEEMIDNDRGSETGYGISSTCGDGDDRVLLVNVDLQRISRAIVNRAGDLGILKDTLKSNSSWSFKEYIKLTPKQLLKVWE